MKNKNILYIEMHSGVSGDMLLSALLGLGLFDADFLVKSLEDLHLGQVELKSEKVSVSGIRAVQSRFVVDEEALWTHDGYEHEHGHHDHRSYKDILAIIDKSALAENIKVRSKAIFKTLALAEGAVHGVHFEDIYFHEVGSLDAIYDIVGFCILVEAMEIETIYSSPFLLGRGEVRCAHGLMPVPVPAVVKILEDKGCPSSQVEEKTGELTTPTGCAIVATCADQFVTPKNFIVKKVAYGAGHKVIPSRPNVLRVSLLSSNDEVASEEDRVCLLETNIDDMSGELLGEVSSILMESGALDVWMSPIFMKKGRGAYKLSILCEETKMDYLGELLFEHTSSIGFRHSSLKRVKLKRENIEVAFEGHMLKAKKVFLPSGKTRIKIEYEDKKRLAKEMGCSLIEIDVKLAQAVDSL